MTEEAPLIDNAKKTPHRFPLGNKFGGRPKGARNKLQENFLAALADDFSEHGAAAIVQMREEKPSEYIKVVASLMPRQLELERPLQELTDDELAAGIAALQNFVDAHGLAEGTGAKAVMDQAESLSSIH